MAYNTNPSPPFKRPNIKPPGMEYAQIPDPPGNTGVRKTSPAPAGLTMGVQPTSTRIPNGKPAGGGREKGGP